MRLLVVAVGKLRPCYREACDDYRRRLRRIAAVEELEVREASRAPGPDQQRDRESSLLLDRIPDRATLVALSRHGKQWTSSSLAKHLGTWIGSGRPLVFAIGGSHGLAPAVAEAATVTWSLSPLTLPHELARVVLYEQIYRAFSILRGMPYHKGSG